MPDGELDPETRALDRELRERVGGEFRTEAEEGERLAARAAQRARDLAAVASELRDRGDRVAVDVAGRTYLGHVVHVGADLLQLRTRPSPPGVRDVSGEPLGAGSVVDVHLAAPVVLRVVQRAREGGHGPQPGPATFRARLLELELADAVVELTAEAVAGAARGRVAAVARDHLVLLDEDATPWFVPLATITTVRTS
jgi:hypothetical protein